MRGARVTAVKVLLVDPDPVRAARLGELLDAEHGFAVAWVSDLDEAATRLEEGETDVVLLAPFEIGEIPMLPGSAPLVPTVVLVDGACELLATQAVRDGADDALCLDHADRPSLRRALAHAVARHARRQDLEQLAAGMSDATPRGRHEGRLAAVGQMTASAAHELNNATTGILLNLQCLREQVMRLERAEALIERHVVSEADAQRRAHLRSWMRQAGFGSALREAAGALADSVEGSRRVQTLAGNLRSMGRLGRRDPERLDLRDVVASGCRLGATELRDKARLVTDLEPVPQLLGDRRQLGLLVLHLLSNAAQSIDEGAADLNEVRVSTRTQGSFAVLTIEDTGCGVPEAMRDPIERLFATMKLPDKVLGVGLALCADVVREHGGQIRFTTSPHGSRFEVLLPCSIDPPVLA